MESSRSRRRTGLVLALLVVAVALSPPIQSFVRFPRELYLPLGEEERLSFIGLPIPVVIRSDRDGLIQLNNKAPSGGVWAVNLGSPLVVRPVGTGRCRLDVTLFGLLTLRRLSVEVVRRPEVSPGGQSIGILLRTVGVSVAGYCPVDGSDGRVHYPGRESGVRVGDIIRKVDGVEVKSAEHVVFLVNRCARDGRAVTLELDRGGQTLRLEVRAVLSVKEHIYQLGLFVRDGAAGVGTLTFHDPKTGIFMALGHMVADAATNRPLEVSDGRVVRASVAGVKPGRRGEPGEKEGTFVEDRDVIGTIQANTEFGLVGVVTAPELLAEGQTEGQTGGRGDEQADGQAGGYGKGAAADSAGAGVPPTIPVALAREVVVGPAEIRTVVNGTQVRSFKCEIIHVDGSQTFPAPKGITLKITDPELLAATGGIVQGMSGSPIIQNGRLVGAVTHVFVNDPTRGYGVFAEWMVREAGLFPAGRESTTGAETGLLEPAAAAGGAGPSTAAAGEGAPATGRRP